MTASSAASGGRPLHVHVLAGNLGSGGAEAVVAEFATAAHGAGIRCTVAHIGDQPSGQAAERVRDAGIPVTRIPTTSLIGRSDRRRVREHVASVAPDILHTHLEYADVLGGLAARSLKLPMVSTMHRAETMPGAYNHAVAALSSIVRRVAADRVIAVSETDRTTYLRSPFEKADHVVAIRNAVGRVPEPGAGRRVREELGIAPDAVVVTMVSVLRPEKGHDVAVEAFREVHRRLPGAVLVVVGDGERRPLVQAAADALGDGAIRLLGERDDVMAVLDASDVFIQPSRAEGLPMALLEAASAGVPLIATSVGGIPELVDDTVGVLLGPVPEPGPLADAIVLLGSDPELRGTRAAAARRRHHDEFDASSWVRKHRAVYDDVLRRRGTTTGA